MHSSVHPQSRVRRLNDRSRRHRRATKRNTNTVAADAAGDCTTPIRVADRMYWGEAIDMRRDRIAYLDGLRGVACLWVVLWHYTHSSHRSLFPYGSTFVGIPVLDHGWAGVELFFLISGYVILLTLEDCTNLREFLGRRWLRLFPAMLIASLTIFAVSRLLGAHMPHGRQGAINLLPGLTFVTPAFWRIVLHRPVDGLDNVFWTLYVEAGFYVIFGLLYFLLGWRKGLLALCAIWVAGLVGPPLAHASGFPSAIPWIGVVRDWLGGGSFGWFASGALFFKSHQSGSPRLFAMAILIGLASVFGSGFWSGSNLVSTLYLSSCVGLFGAAQKYSLVQRALCTRQLLFVGSVSYPLYLLHHEIGIGLIAVSPSVVPRFAWLAVPILMLAFMLAVAWIVARWLEPIITARLRPFVRLGTQVDNIVTPATIAGWKP